MPQLQVLSGKRQGFVLDIDADEVVDVGNRKTAKLSIRDPWISWNHAKITRDGGKFFVEDTGSSNGTWVNGEKVKRRELKANDVIYFGKTKVKFAVAGAAATPPPGGSAPAAGAPAAPARQEAAPKQDAPWWDRVIEPSGAPAGGADSTAMRQLELQLRDERRMREALEKFLDVPRGTPLGDAARAGQLEQRVRELERELDAARAAAAAAPPPAPAGPDPEQLEKLRREHATRTVELEEKAKAAEHKAVDLENRLKDRSEQAKKELQRSKDKLQGEIDELKKALDAARAAGGKGGDEAVKAERERADRLAQDLDHWRGEALDAQKKLEEAQQELASLRGNAPSAAELERLEKALAEAKADATRWEEEHKKVVQEIDEISMEQIDVEDALNQRIRELEARLGGEPAEA